ncbi:MAG: hypothetical protein ABI539_07685 [Acidobacteriota bacterium]
MEDSKNYLGGFDRHFYLNSFGVTVKVESNAEDLLQRALKEAYKALNGQLSIIENVAIEPPHSFGMAKDLEGMLYFFEDGKQMSRSRPRRPFFRYFNSMLRLRVAEFAKDRVFVHAGVVSWHGQAIILPANSFRGKTSLVEELIRLGAEYYSDEYAVIDENGSIHPFSRPLSKRYSGTYLKEKDVPVERIGAVVGTEPVPAGLILVTEYSKGATLMPEILTPGQGMIELIPHTIPIRENTEFTLKVLNKVVSRAIIAKSLRGEAHESAKILLSFFDGHL